MLIVFGIPKTISQEDRTYILGPEGSHGSWIKSSNMPLNYLRLYINAKVQKGRMQKGRVGAKRQGGKRQNECKKAGCLSAKRQGGCKKAG
jgi:hypothetical protein